MLHPATALAGYVFVTEGYCAIDDLLKSAFGLTSEAMHVIDVDQVDTFESIFCLHDMDDDHGYDALEQRRLERATDLLHEYGEEFFIIEFGRHSHSRSETSPVFWLARRGQSMLGVIGIFHGSMVDE